MKGLTILSLVGVAVIMLIIGTALGSVAFPMTKTETTKQTVASTIIVSTTVIQNQTQSSYFVIYSGNGSVTVSKEILEEQVEHMQVETSGNCTVSGGTSDEYLTNTTTTEYLLPSFVSNSSENPMLVTAIFTTVTSSVSGIGTTDTTAVSFNISEYGNVTEIFLSTRTSGTETYVVTATCPIVA